VIIHGSSFISSNTQVFFGSNAALSVFVLSDTLIKAIAPPGTGTVNVTVVTPDGASPNLPGTHYTYRFIRPFPPSHFLGRLVVNQYSDSTEYFLNANWDPSTSSDVIAYRIYQDSQLVAEISSDSCLIFEAQLNSEADANNYYVAALNADNLESTIVKIKIIQE
jgi:hypothetical protein